MWGGGGTGGSGGGGGLDPSALAGYASMGWVEDNYVSKAFFNQLFELQYNHRVLTKNGETVVSDVTTAMVAAPNEVVDLVSHTETDEETGYTIITTNTITGIKAKAGLWTNQYLSALGQNAGGGGGGGATLFEPLLSINESGLAAPTDAQDGMTVVWDKNTHKWKYGATGGGNADRLDGWHLDNIVNTGYISSSVANLQSYWCKIWDVTVTDKQYNDLDITFLAASAFNSIEGIIHLKIRQNGANNSGNYSFSKFVRLVAGYIPLERVKLYCDNTTGKCELWMNVNGQYGVFNVSILKKSFRVGQDEASIGTLYSTFFTEEQTPPALSEAEIVGMTAYDLVGNAESATKLATARTLWGQSFDGTANVSGNMTGVGNISANGNYISSAAVSTDIQVSVGNNNGTIALLTSTNRGIYDNSTNRWLLATNGTNTWLTGGNVGIGTSAPAYKLDVDGTINCTSIRIGGYLITADSVNGGLHLNNGGFWADTFISALGLNSSGGGGGGSSTLAGLNDVSLSNPSNGQILQYNGTHWVNANAPQTGVTSVAAGTGLTTDITGGGAITSTGTISLSSATQTDIAKGVTAYGWGNHALAGYAQNSALNDYLPLAGGTMRGVITLGHSTTEGSSYSSAISVAIRTVSGTRADTYTYGNWIHGGEDHADQDGANIQIGTWFGFGIYPTINGMARTQGKNSFWHNARTGNTYTWGNFYCYDGTNNNKVATENWVNGAYLPLAGGTMTGTLRLLTGSSVGIEASDNAGLLVYKPESGWSGVSNTQWAVGALSAQGVIRSNDNSLLHYNGTNNYKIWDEGNDGSGSGLDADLLDGIHAKDMLIHYQLPRNVTASTYWHKLGEYITGGDNSNLILEVYSGSGYNSTGNQNSWAKIIIKDGWQSPTSETGVGPTNSVGVSVEEYGYYSTGIKVIVVATEHNKGAVWVQLPWQYAVGDYVVYGRYTSWTHNNSIDSDTTTAPTSNQNPVYYYRNLSYLNKNGQEAVTLQHDFSVKAGVDGAQLRIGNILLKYDATNKALKIEHQGTNGVEAGNIYATGAVSALGANTSGGGGGGGASTLSDLLDVALSSPSNGQVLTYDNATGKWVNADVPTPSMTGYATENWVDQNYLKSVAFSDLTSHPTTLSGYGITDAKIQNGTITLGSNTITPLTSVAFNDLTSHPTTLSGYGITDAKIDSGTITLGSSTITPLTSVAFNDLTSHPTTIAGYGITDAKFGTFGADYVPITLGSTTKNVLTAHQSLSAYATQTWVTNNFLGLHATADAATKLATARELWGQSFDGTAAVTGTLSYVGDINSNALGSINNFNKIELNAAANAGNGGAIYFHYNGMSGRSSGYIINDADGLVSVLTYTGNIGLKVGTQNGDYLQIGAVRLMYDTSNNALKVIKSDGTAANFYATGGVSALGISSGSGGSVENLTMTGTLKFSVNGMDSTIYADNNGYLHIDGSENVVIGNDLVTDGYSIHTHGGNVECGTGKVYASRFYVGTGRYIYLDGTTLKYNDNGTVKTIVLS